MGCFKYCDHCNEPMDGPTFKEALGIEEYYCPQCHKENPVPASTRKEALEDLVDRVEKIEHHLSFHFEDFNRD